MTSGLSLPSRALKSRSSVSGTAKLEVPQVKQTVSLGNTKTCGVFRFSIPEKWMQISESSSSWSCETHSLHIMRALWLTDYFGADTGVCDVGHKPSGCRLLRRPVGGQGRPVRLTALVYVRRLHAYKRGVRWGVCRRAFGLLLSAILVSQGTVKSTSHAWKLRPLSRFFFSIAPKLCKKEGILF